MKGMVFTELMDLVDARFGPEVLEQTLDAAGSSGSYTAVGSYPHQEIVAIVLALSARTGVPVPTLLTVFGEHLFLRFTQLYPEFFAEGMDTFAFLQTIEEHVHLEVRKLYPDAELPTFTTAIQPDGALEMVYRSRRAMGDLALGLINGAVVHFGESISVHREDQSPGGDCVRFLLRRLG